MPAKGGTLGVLLPIKGDSGLFELATSRQYHPETHFYSTTTTPHNGLIQHGILPDL